jgi:hypothetical protein
MALDATDRVEVLKGVKEISAAMTRMEAERDFIRDTKKKIADEQGLDKKALNRLIKTYHKGNFPDESSAWNEFAELYTSVVGAK